MMFRSALVTTKGRPIGRQPCETTVRSRTGPLTWKATAPSANVCGPKSRRLSPGSAAPLAMPPTTGTPGRSSFIRSSRKSAGNENGSPRTIRNDPGRHSPASSSGQPSSTPPSGVRSNSRCSGVSVTPGQRASHSDSAGSSSTSRPVPAIASPVQPSRLSFRAVRRRRQPDGRPPGRGAARKTGSPDRDSRRAIRGPRRSLPGVLLR